MKYADPANVAKASDLASGDPWIWLYEIEVPTTPATRLRLAADTDSVTFGTDSEGVDLVYSPFPITHNGMPETSEGDLPAVDLIVSNVSREVQALLEAYNGLVGQDVRIMLVNRANLLSGIPVLREDFQVLSVTSDASSAVAKLGQTDLWNALFPSNRVTRDYCRFQYKGARCGYTGGLTTCDKIVAGDNGCEAHANTPRFGGFPGTPRDVTS